MCVFGLVNVLAGICLFEVSTTGRLHGCADFENVILAKVLYCCKVNVSLCRKIDE